MFVFPKLGGLGAASLFVLVATLGGCSGADEEGQSSPSDDPAQSESADVPYCAALGTCGAAYQGGGNTCCNGSGSLSTKHCGSCFGSSCPIYCCLPPGRSGCGSTNGWSTKCCWSFGWDLGYCYQNICYGSWGN